MQNITPRELWRPLTVTWDIPHGAGSIEGNKIHLPDLRDFLRQALYGTDCLTVAPPIDRRISQ